MPATSYHGCQLLCVGQAPGHTEDKHGKPFIGKAGQYLRQELASVGVAMDRVAYMNVASCWPGIDRKTGRDLAPGNNHLFACRPNVTMQLRHARPDVVLVCGQVAAKEFIRGTDVDLKLDLGRPWVVYTPTIPPAPFRRTVFLHVRHPSYTMNQSKPNRQRWSEHLKMAWNLTGVDWQEHWPQDCGRCGRPGTRYTRDGRVWCETEYPGEVAVGEQGMLL